MKKLLLLSICCSLFAAAFSQDALSKVKAQVPAAAASGFNVAKSIASGYHGQTGPYACVDGHSETKNAQHSNGFLKQGNLESLVLLLQIRHNMPLSWQD